MSAWGPFFLFFLFFFPGPISMEVTFAFMDRSPRKWYQNVANSPGKTAVGFYFSFVFLSERFSLGRYQKFRISTDRDKFWGECFIMFCVFMCFFLVYSFLLCVSCVFFWFFFFFFLVFLVFFFFFFFFFFLFFCFWLVLVFVFFFFCFEDRFRRKWYQYVANSSKCCKFSGKDCYGL